VNTIEPTHDGDAVARRSLLVPLIIVVFAMVFVVGGILGVKIYFGGKFAKIMAAAAQMPQTVSTVTAAKSSWQAQIEAVGSTRAVRGADLSAQASGIVEDLEFDSGNDVAAGKPLLTLRPYDDPAKLSQLEAAAELAEQTLKRDQVQLAAQAVSQAQIDTDVSTLKAARAQVAAQQQLIKEKVIYAPFAGRLGIRQVDVGQYLNAGTTIVTLQALDPILIDFYVPQQALGTLKIGDRVMANVDTYPGVSFSGTLEAINSKVDAASRNVQVRASFHNADKRLVPGMFATVSIQAGEPHDEVTLPQTCITYNPYGDTVYVVQHGAGHGPDGKPTNTVQQRFVKLGATRGDQVTVLSGVDVGDEVVSAGQMKLRNGSAVVINNSVEPSNDAHPNPPNE
jgi:membrane fusion protein (multidrug efflux system)